LKKNSQLFLLMIFYKKGLCTAGAETQLGKKLIWPPIKLSSCKTQERLFADIPPAILSSQADDTKNHRVVKLRKNKDKLTPPPLSARLNKV
jgi:hypothetical protein